MKMVKLLSGFSITGRNEEIPEAAPEADPDDPFAGMDPAKSGELMKELEGSIYVWIDALELIFELRKLKSEFRFS